MAEEVHAKSKTIGYIEANAAKKIPGWTTYKTKADALTKAREESQTEKDKIRTEIKRALKHDGNIDFVVETGGKVMVFENLQSKEAGSRTTDLSGMFR